MDFSFCANSQLSGRGDKIRGGLIVASNREPYSHRKTGRGLKLEIPTGGLVSALDMVLKVTGGTWVAWGSGSGDREATDADSRIWVPPLNPSYRLRRVWLSPESISSYYHGFCNLFLWPLFHGEPDRILYRKSFWEYYERVNQAFVDAILAEGNNDSTIWIHDYHLCLAPSLLRAASPERTIAHFWHVPWPDGELFRTVPQSEALLTGLLGNDLIGFQIPLYACNFMASAAACLGAAIDYDAMTVTWQGRITRVRSFPISTDFQHFDSLATASATEIHVRRLRIKHRLPKLVGLSVDRLDYTKGIIERLQALEHFFQSNLSFRSTFTFIQIAVMTRNGAPYRAYRQDVEALVVRINDRFATTDWQPIVYSTSRLDQEELAAYYRLADIAVITPLCDGMNLVAKEYVAARTDGEGVLILGQSTGAAAELEGALLVDPTDRDAFVTTLRRALTMSRVEKLERMALLRGQVRRNTIYGWVGDILDELALIPQMKGGGRNALQHGAEIAARLAGRELLICLDFDGTLAPIVACPELAEMPADIRAQLIALQGHHSIVILSGRSLADVRARTGLPGLTYMGNHGTEMEGDATGAGALADDRLLLKEFLAMAERTFTNVPGVLIEDKGVTASIHFRMVAPSYLETFLEAFKPLAKQYTGRLRVTEGRKVIEIFPQTAGNKGVALQRLMAGVSIGIVPVYLGDDVSDECAFHAVRGCGISVSVGGSPAADYYLRNQGEVAGFLSLLSSSSHRRDFQVTGNQIKEAESL